MPYRVAQWSTGNVGRYALRGIINHPDLELVGLWVHSPDKAGTDAGELAGVGPVGVIATNSTDEILALQPDCVCYTATADQRPFEAVEDLAMILRSGASVVSSSLVMMVYPHNADASFVEPLSTACADGNSSFFTSGIDPGFANDLIPLALASASERVDSIRVMEILNYDTYDQPTVLFDTMGFAHPEDHVPMLLQPGILGFAWGGTLRALAAGLGLELDGIEEHYERVTTDETFEVPSGTVEKGTVAGLRFEVRGMVDGKARVIVEHVTRLRDDIAPDWPQPAGGGCYRIVIEGEPRIVTDVQLMGEHDGDHNTGGLVATAMRLVNAIPAVCDADPGLKSVLDIPLATPPT
jgi:4-hydroxy-tetrahydrodipicolinate reductase